MKQKNDKKPAKILSYTEGKEMTFTLTYEGKEHLCSFHFVRENGNKDFAFHLLRHLENGSVLGNAITTRTPNMDLAWNDHALLEMALHVLPYAPPLGAITSLSGLTPMDNDTYEDILSSLQIGEYTKLHTYKLKDSEGTYEMHFCCTTCGSSSNCLCSIFYDKNGRDYALPLTALTYDAFTDDEVLKSYGAKLATMPRKFLCRFSSMSA